MKFFVIIFAFAIFALVQAANFEDCGSVNGKFTRVAVSSCSDSDKDCVLKKNTNVTISIDFTSDVDTVSLKTVVHGHVLGMDVPFPLQNPDACSSVSCPVAKGAKYEYEATLPILNTYPKVKVIVKWELVDESGKDIVCVSIPAQVK